MRRKHFFILPVLSIIGFCFLTHQAASGQAEKNNIQEAGPITEIEARIRNIEKEINNEARLIEDLKAKQEAITRKKQELQEQDYLRETKEKKRIQESSRQDAERKRLELARQEEEKKIEAEKRDQEILRQLEGRQEKLKEEKRLKTEQQRERALKEIEEKKYKGELARQEAEKQRQSRIESRKQAAENLRKDKLLSKLDSLAKKHKELVEERQRLEQFITTQEENVKALEDTRAALAEKIKTPQK